jgi:hypothetical protein
MPPIEPRTTAPELAHARIWVNSKQAAEGLVELQPGTDQPADGANPATFDTLQEALSQAMSGPDRKVALVLGSPIAGYAGKVLGAAILADVKRHEDLLDEAIKLNACRTLVAGKLTIVGMMSLLTAPVAGDGVQVRTSGYIVPDGEINGRLVDLTTLQHDVLGIVAGKTPAAPPAPAPAPMTAAAPSLPLPSKARPLPPYAMRLKLRAKKIPERDIPTNLLKLAALFEQHYPPAPDSRGLAMPTMVSPTDMIIEPDADGKGEVVPRVNENIVQPQAVMQVAAQAGATDDRLGPNTAIITPGVEIAATPLARLIHRHSRDSLAGVV